MATFDFTTLMNSLESHAASLGFFDQVNAFQPPDVPNTGITCGIWAQRIGPDTKGSGLNSTSGRIEMNVRVYTSAEQTPYDAIDPQVMNAISALLGAYNGNFTLGGLARNVDVMEASAQAGYIDQAGNKIRVMTIVLPITINDLWQQVA